MGKIVGLVIETKEPQAKDLNKMTVVELTSYAAEKEIDIEGITLKADILAKIKESEDGEQ